MKKNLPTKEEVRKEIDENRNHSWIREVIGSDELADKVFYSLDNGIKKGSFGEKFPELNVDTLRYLYSNEIKLSDAIYEGYQIAKGLKARGVKKGEKLVIFIDKSPEYAYLAIAASILGLELEITSDHFAPEYIEEIINDSTIKYVFINDTKVAGMEEIIKKSDKKFVCVPYLRSAIKRNPYEEVFNSFYPFDKKEFNEVLKRNKNIIDIDDFILASRNYNGIVENTSSLDDCFTITFSSGTTKRGFNKAIRHSNRHYITMARYHDPEVSGIQSISDLVTYCNIPGYSNSYFSSSFSDNMIRRGHVVLDPIDDERYFLFCAMKNESNMNISTTSTWLESMRLYYEYPEFFKGMKLSGGLFNFAAGEALTVGEEKALNKFLKKVKAGVNLTKVPIATMSVAGSDCEHGSIFIRLLRQYASLLPRKNKKEPIGMEGYDFVDINVLRKDGTYAEPYELGLVVCNSDCTMLSYENNEEATNNFYVTDAYGKKWGSMNVYGYIDEHKNLTMKGRYEPDEKLPIFMLEDCIGKDTKNIMSVTVSKIPVGDDFIYVADIICQYGKKNNIVKILESAEKRVRSEFGEEIAKSVQFRYANEWPLTGCKKRDFPLLRSKGLTDIIPKSLYSTIEEKEKAKTLLKK